MNVPAIAKKTFDEYKSKPEFLGIVKTVLDRLQQIKNKIHRARYVHELVDDFNKDVFAHPLVQKLSPCKINCTGCCHTQVSVTSDEAELLALKVREGLDVDLSRLKIQMSAQNKADQYFSIKFEDRKCVFLSAEGACRVYHDRPSVCRTNAVLGSAEQCDTRTKIQNTILVKTPQSDMVIYASFLDSEESGTLPYMLGKALKLNQEKNLEDEAI